MSGAVLQGDRRAGRWFRKAVESSSRRPPYCSPIHPGDEEKDTGDPEGNHRLHRVLSAAVREPVAISARLVTDHAPHGERESSGEGLQTELNHRVSFSVAPTYAKVADGRERLSHTPTAPLAAIWPQHIDMQVIACLSCGVSDVYKALADSTRRTILDELLERDRQTLFELCGRLASRHGLTSSRQAVSQHLEVLQAAGLVKATKEGRYKFHSIDTAPLRTITDRWPPREKAEGTPMTEALTHGTLESIDGRPSLRFELSLSHPIERVWQAVSTPSELGRVFPGAADWTPAEGEVVDLGGMSVEVTQVEAPHILTWVFADQPQSFELTREGDRTRLVFTHVIDDLPSAQTAAGWEIYLSRLEPHLDGEYVSDEQAHRRWTEIHERYAERFGVDPTPGREWAAQNLPVSGG